MAACSASFSILETMPQFKYSLGFHLLSLLLSFRTTSGNLSIDQIYRCPGSFVAGDQHVLSLQYHVYVWFNTSQLLGCDDRPLDGFNQTDYSLWPDTQIPTEHGEGTYVRDSLQTEETEGRHIAIIRVDNSNLGRPVIFDCYISPKELPLLSTSFPCLKGIPCFSIVFCIEQAVPL